MVAVIFQVEVALVTWVLVTVETAETDRVTETLSW